MAEENQKVVDGFLFMTTEDAKLAKSELAKIELLEEKLDYENLEKVKLVYEKSLQTRMFKTQVGISFLRKLQNCLKEHQVDDTKISDIPVSQVYQIREQTSPVQKQVKPAAVKPKKSEAQKQREQKNMSIFINAVLILLVAMMFYMTTRSATPNVLNYERALQNKYASWEEELSQREQVIREKEKELLINGQ